MKKRLLLLTTLAVMLLTSLVAFAGCELQHTHSFDQQVTKDAFFKKAATCMSKATYYYSCECGEKGIETFESGELGNHNFANNQACTACNATYGLIYEFTDSGEAYFVSGISMSASTIKKIIIPNTYNKRPVVGIGSSAFYYCSSLTSITIPDSVTSIGESAFHLCSRLTSITIPDSVTSIGEYAFSNCTSLTSITIPGGVTSIGNRAFYKCSSLTSITIPNSVTSVGERAFEDCDSLISVTIGNSVTNIGYRAFYKCSSLASIVIPDSVTSIGNYAFSNCSSLTSITIGNSVTSIGNSAFYNCYRLVEVVNKSSHITVTKGSEDNGYVGLYALDVYNSGDTFASKLSKENGYIIYTDGQEKILVGYIGNKTSLTLPSYITKINNDAFYECSSLTSVTILDSVTSIGDRAFFRCSSLKSINIPDGVTSIGNSAFSGCSNLEYNIKDELKYLGNKENKYLYLAEVVSKDITQVEIDKNCKFIGSSAFSKCSSLTSITIPDSVTSIGDNAFSGCSNLEYNIKDELKYLGNEENKYLYLAEVVSKDITQVEIDKNCKFVGSSAFRACSNLTSVTIGNGVTSIGEYAFAYCSSLTSITIPDSLKSIGEWVFVNCSSLTNITIPDSVMSIGEYAFRGCSSLTSVYYMGTASEWSKISIGAGNDELINAIIYYNSQTEPTESGNYWHFDTDGKTPIVCTKEN